MKREFIIYWWDRIIHWLRFRCGMRVVFVDDQPMAGYRCKVCCKNDITPEVWEQLRIKEEKLFERIKEREGTMRVGFTGTREGLTDAQSCMLTQILDSVQYTQYHHGDCLGADEQFHKMVVQRGAIPDVHPPSNPKLRANCKSGMMYKPKPYPERNKDIVNMTDCLIACPKGTTEELYSGTWQTIRYARDQGKPITIIYPAGNIVEENKK